MVNQCLPVTSVMKVLIVKQRLKKHINDKHESLMSEDLNDIDLYEGFDEDGHIIV